MCNLVLVSKYENGLMIISISSRQVRARKIILNLVSKNCTFSREWDSKSKPITVLHRRKSYDMIFDKQDHEYSTSHQAIWLELGGTGSVEGCTRSVIAVREGIQKKILTYLFWSIWIFWTHINDEPYCRSLIKVKFSTDQFRPALGSGGCRLSIVDCHHAQKT